MLETDPIAYLASLARRSGRSFWTPGQPVIETRAGKVLIYAVGDKPSESEPTVEVALVPFAKMAAKKFLEKSNEQVD